MSREFEAMLQELQSYQMRCADQEDIIAMLEREINRLNNELKLIQVENQKLTAMVLGQSSPKPEEVPAAVVGEPASKKDVDNGTNELNAESGMDGTPPEENPIDDNEPGPADDDAVFDKIPPDDEDEKPKFKNYKEKVIHECQEFIKDFTFLAFYNEISKDILGQEEGLKRILAVIYNFIYTLSLGKKPDKCNTVVLTAPSGNGKTALFKSLKDFFEAEIPSLVCSRKDASKLVPEGYRGNSVTTVLSDFAPYQKWEIEQKYGFLWLDEFDKIRFNSDGSGPLVQNQLLTYMDGCTEKHKHLMVDTHYIFWVAAGSFNEVRNKKKMKASEKTIGFTSEENESYDAFDDITREDMLQIFSHETVGRFNLIVNFKRISHDSVKKVISKTMEDICKRFQVDIALNEDYINTLTRSANSEFGCRQIYSTVFETCLQAYIEFLQNYKVDEQPLIIIEGPGDFTILDGSVADQIEYDNIEE